MLGIFLLGYCNYLNTFFCIKFAILVVIYTIIFPYITQPYIYIYKLLKKET